MNDSRVFISRAAILHNVRLLRRAIPHGTKICAVVKADAYGHGAEIVVDTLTNFAFDDADAPAVDALAVATIDEAAALPSVNVPVLILRPVENVFISRNREALEQAIRNDWQLTLISASAAEDVNRVAMSCGKRALVHVMADTGLTRCGAPIDALDDLLAKVESRSGLKLAGLATHFANAHDASDRFAPEQLVRFLDATGSFAASRRIARHVANSGAIFYWPDSRLEMVRPGIALYGIDPSGAPHLDRPLRPALKWTAPLIAIHDIRRGATVGYGQTWIAPRNTKIGLVPVGYGDGYPRLVSNQSVMMFDGRPAPVAGRVSMDYTAIDLGPDSHARIGDEVTVLDDDPLSPASVYALASQAQTITYEIFTRIGRRVQRLSAESTTPQPQHDAAEEFVDE